jgi:hypothetical protein
MTRTWDGMRLARARVVASLVVIALALAGCAGGGPGGKSGGGGGGGGCTCDPAAGCPSVSLSTNIQPIFNRSCSQSAACHAGGSPPQDLNLQVGQTYGQTVGVRATEKAGEIRVKPGKPDDSFLIKKIEFTPGTPGLQMPVGCPGAPTQGAVCLSPDDIAAIRQWITDCAPNN